MPDSSASDRPSGMPGDYGLPGLGSMMQLWAGLEALALVSVLFFTLRLSMGRSGLALILVGLGLVRAVTHYIAGTEIRAGGMKVPGRVRAFLIVSIIDVIGLLWIGPGPLEAAHLLQVADVLLWPLLLVTVLHLPAWRERFRQVSEGELELRGRNRGIEAAGMMMVVLGTSGAVLTGAIAWAFFDEGLGSSSFAKLSMWVQLAAVALLLRSIVHVAIGVSAMRGASPDVFRRRVQLYVRVHWVSTVIAVAPVLYAVSNGVDLMGTLAFAIVTMLSVWPLVLRGFAAQVGGEFGERDSTGFDRAPDGGLVTAGWFLCALAAGSAVQAVFFLLEGSANYATVGFLDAPRWFVHPELPVWVGVVGVATTLWAGLELIAGTVRARAAALVFAASTIAVALWSRADALRVIGAVDPDMGGSIVQIQTIMFRAGILLSLVVPVMVAFLALRTRPRQSASTPASG